MVATNRHVSLREVLVLTVLTLVLTLAGLASTIGSHRYVGSSMAVADLSPVQMAHLATDIVRGTVVSQVAEIAPDGNRVLTRSKIRVMQTFKGIPSSLLVVTTHGGTAGNITEYAADQASLPVGRDVVVFLIRENGDLVPVAGYEGRFFIAQNRAVSEVLSLDLGELISAATH
jgi:hypothetical protein